MTIDYKDFEKVDVRVGQIVSVDDFPSSRKPSYKLLIDFGSDIGKKKSIGQFPDKHTKEQLLGMKVACVVNFEPRQIGPGLSEVLTLGFPDEHGKAVLITPVADVPIGGRLF